MENTIGKNLAKALVKAMAQIEGASKDSINPHFRNKYADLASVTDAIKKPLNENGLAYSQIIHRVEGGVGVETIIIHESGETMSNGITFVPAPKNDPHGYGSALTYARRYSLMAACGIAPEDDDGNTAVRKPIIDETALIDHLAAIEASTDQDSLKNAYKAAYTACNGNADWQKKVIAAKDKVKAKL